MSRLAILFATVVAFAAHAVHGATVYYSLYPDSKPGQIFTTPGSFYVTAKVCGCDNGGLSGYGFDLIGNITSLDHRSPRDPSAMTSTKEGPTGFTLGRSADNVNFIVGTQDIGNQDAILIYGIGKESNSFANLGIAVGGSTLEQPSWDAELVLAVGTYSGGWPGQPSFVQSGPNAGANVFAVRGETRVLPAEVKFYAFGAGIDQPPCPVPETSTFWLSGFAICSVIAVSRSRLASSCSG